MSPRAASAWFVVTSASCLSAAYGCPPSHPGRPSTKPVHLRSSRRIVQHPAAVCRCGHYGAETPTPPTSGQCAEAVAHKVVGHGICHCPEGRRLFPELSVWRNLMLGAYLRSDKDGIEQDLARVYALFPVLAERKRQQASTLSGGQQQMLAIGRALMGRPILLLLDE